MHAFMGWTVAVCDPLPHMQVLERFHAWVTSASAPEGWTLEEVNHEGWRVAVSEPGAPPGRSGWVLLRQSLHDPLLVLNVESEVAGGVAVLTGHVAGWVREACKGLPLDLSSMPPPPA